MGQELRTSRSKGKHYMGKRKVKSGCHTCRIRKVKCDESFPVCHRCMSTGRTCEGYGIWGGGGAGGKPGVACSTIHPRSRLPPLPGNGKPGYGSIIGPLYSPACHYPVVLDEGDKARFEWFRHRSAPKLPGTFVTGFWTKLVFQAASTEPSVLHAVLALGTVHRTPTLSDNTAASQEVITLRHYTKAIRHLQYHLNATGRASLHVSLIGCVIFICLELLRGHFETAHRHMDNGLKVLVEAQESLSAVPAVHQPRAKMLDGWIAEMFTRLRLQFRLFHQGRPRPCFDFPVSLRGPLPSTRFHSTNEAWQYLGQLLDRAIEISNQARAEHDAGSALLISTDALKERQERNRADLSQWLKMYNLSLDIIRTETPRGDQRTKLYLLILQYYTMAEIMTATCISPYDELAYDLQTTKFLTLLQNGITLLKTAPELNDKQISMGNFVLRHLSIIDMGWIAPLFYTATKCRVHQIRTQAMRLLSTSEHQEGTWDSKLSVCVVRKVIELEERDFYEGLLGDLNFPLLQCPQEQDLVLPTIPESYRIHGIEMDLLGEPLDRVKLTCSQKQDGVDRTVFEGEYILASQEWGSVR
uniref:Zn(2)-C6 fungal-type domain-containing protein n=1 Tax=Bionectria ochroleuca TaxID=29856 RepID=A0A0B7KAR3_BIOOC